MPVTQATNGLHVVFGAAVSCCLTPGVVAGAPSPLPYPSIAKTATKVQQAQLAGPTAPKAPVGSKTPVPSKTALVTRTGGANTVRIGTPTMSSELRMFSVTGNPGIHNEVAQLRSALDAAHSKARGLSSHDPNEWQKAFQEYAVTLAAIFTTLRA